MSVRYPRIMDGMYCGTMNDQHVKTILSMRNAECIDSLKHMIFNFPPELVMRSIEEGKSIRTIVKEENIDIQKEGYIGELRNYQTTGTGFMYMSPRSIIGDGVGLGKTVEISALLNILKQRQQMNRFLMAVESSASGQTLAELIKYTGMMIVYLPSTKKEMLKVIDETDWNIVDGIVIKHSAIISDTLNKWIGLNTPEGGNKCNLFDTFILDESSVVKNNKTKIYNYLVNICQLCRRVHFMNATIFETNIMDIYYQIDIVDSNILPAKTRIEKEFSVYKRSKGFWTRDESGKPKQKFSWERAGYKNQEEFKSRLRLVYFARCKADIGLDRPNVYKIYEVDPTRDQQLALMENRYNEVLNCPSLIPELGIPMNRKNVPKLDKLCELIENDFADSKVMIYCFNIEAQEAIAEEMRNIGRNPLILNGQDKSKDKDINRIKIMNEFNTGSCDVIITNIMRSLNLYNGDACIIYSLVSNPSKQTQIAGRIDRNVDDKTKTFVLLLYRGTDEEKLFKNVVGKREFDARSLTIDAKGAVSHFIESIDNSEGTDNEN